MTTPNFPTTEHEANHRIHVAEQRHDFAEEAWNEIRWRRVTTAEELTRFAEEMEPRLREFGAAVLALRIARLDRSILVMALRQKAVA